MLLRAFGLSLALSATLMPVAMPAFADDAAASAQTQAAGETDQLVVRGMDTLAVGGDAFDVATAVGLKANTQYVLYEAEAPDGFGTFADVTFTVDDRGAVQLVDGAWSSDTLNAYTAGSTLSAVDYTHKELVDKKV